MTWGFSQLIFPLSWTFLPRSFPTLGTRFSSTQLKRPGTAHWAASFFFGFWFGPILTTFPFYTLQIPHLACRLSSDFLSCPGPYISAHQRENEPSRWDRCPLFPGKCSLLTLPSPPLTMGSLWIKILCSSLLPNHIPLYEQTTLVFTHHQPSSVGLFLHSALGTNTAVNISWQVFVWTRALGSLRSTRGCGTVGPHPLCSVV